VPLLPEELARAQKGRRVLELPPDHVAPLVELELKRQENDIGGGSASID